MRYELAIFDFDGTLADSFPWFLAALNDCAPRFGFRRIEPHEVEMLRGYDGRRIMRHMRVSMWKMPMIARSLRARMAADLHRIELFPGVEAMLRRLADAGVRIAVVTSNSAENVRRVLGPESAALVRHVEGGASIFGKQPKMRKVLRASGVPASRAISIGDEIRDLHASRAAGMAFGAVGWGFATPDALRALKPEMFFEHVDEIADRVIG
ncbi:HAD hydrolase-like protein [Longimicrobium sp.]|uniref:HAD hydrolase-like protein n=1 Tax=Longimicrobium sp. TaxID=2029185 RepID=UPI002E334EBB|nr:HAD hydrolase-like protein [Longimicrobium sp.]HEX6037740.1 HAD hydrolase-like protein [Longimicrobium sp.]